jgi:glutathione synthase/RimK-type ligase-like ATP-grasp enzyme
MNLLFGPADDTILGVVAGAFERLGAPALVIDQRRPPPSWKLDGDGTGHIAGVDLAEISSVYLRPADLRAIARNQGWSLDGPELQDAARFATEFLAATEFTDWLVVNRLSAQASNLSKPWQLEQIKRWFEVPRTLVTTDPDEARGFAASFPAVIVKSVSGVRSIVRQLTDDRLAALGDVANCPTLLQECIEGIDVRVHVVGDLVYATEVTSAATDYRYDPTSRHRHVDLPHDIVRRCVELSEHLGLPVSGIDFRRRADGSYVCFEANPSPGFVYFEPFPAHPIADAIAAFMADHRRAPVVHPPSSGAVSEALVLLSRP